jgi:hypothetical protein
MTIEELELFRGETGVSESIAYLNNARVSPYPRPTLEGHGCKRAGY